MDEIRILSSLEEVKALSDPYRYRILNCLYEMKEPATVKQLADKLGEVPAKVHYHIKKLEKHDIVMLDHTEEIKGIIAKFYKPTAQHFEIKCSSDLDKSAKALMLGETQRMISEMYENSREIFIKQFEKNSELKQEDKIRGIVSADELYLTEEQAAEFQLYLQRFFQMHKKEVVDENKKKYYCFFSMTGSE